MAAPSSSEEEHKSQTPTIDEICFRYAPFVGAAGSMLFSTYIMNPTIYSRLFGQWGSLVANGVWFNAHMGVGMYLYGRRHLQIATTKQRIMFCTFGTVVFNFGSVLLFATSKVLLPRNSTFRVLVGIATGALLLYTGREYILHIDSTCAGGKAK